MHNTMVVTANVPRSRLVLFHKMASLIQRGLNAKWLHCGAGLSPICLRVNFLPVRATCHYRWLSFYNFRSRAAMLTPDAPWNGMQDEVHIYRDRALALKWTRDFSLVLTDSRWSLVRCLLSPILRILSGASYVTLGSSMHYVASSAMYRLVQRRQQRQRWWWRWSCPCSLNLLLPTSVKLG